MKENDPEDTATFFLKNIPQTHTSINHAIALTKEQLQKRATTKPLCYDALVAPYLISASIAHPIAQHPFVYRPSSRPEA